MQLNQDSSVEPRILRKFLTTKAAKTAEHLTHDMDPQVRKLPWDMRLPSLVHARQLQKEKLKPWRWLMR